MKYIVVQRTLKPGQKMDLRPKYPILFPDHLVHDMLVPEGHEAVSAGECVLTPVVECFGSSESLGLSAEKEADTYLIDLWLTTGESMLIMASETYDDMVELKGKRGKRNKN